jgi:hypothetical protein
MTPVVFLDARASIFDLGVTLVTAGVPGITRGTYGSSVDDWLAVVEIRSRMAPSFTQNLSNPTMVQFDVAVAAAAFQPFVSATANTLSGFGVATTSYDIVDSYFSGALPDIPELDIYIDSPPLAEEPPSVYFPWPPDWFKMSIQNTIIPLGLLVCFLIFAGTAYEGALKFRKVINEAIKANRRDVVDDIYLKIKAQRLHGWFVLFFLKRMKWGSPTASGVSY